MRDLIAPQPGLAIAFGQSGETAARPKRIANIANGPFHTPFLIPGTGLTRPGREMIMRTELNQARVKINVIAAPFQNRTLEVVI